MIQEVSEWLRKQPKSFFEVGIKALSKPRSKCGRVGGELKKVDITA